MINQQLDPNDTTTIARLKKMNVFARLDDIHMAEIIKLAKLRKYETEELIISEGAYDQMLYFLITGEISIVHEGVEVGRISRLGEVFGEMGIIDGSPRSASIKALKPTLCLAIEAAFLDRLSGAEKVKAEAIFFRGFAEILAHRLRDCLGRVLVLENELGASRKQTKGGA